MSPERLQVSFQVTSSCGDGAGAVHTITVIRVIPKRTWKKSIALSDIRSTSHAREPETGVKVTVHLSKRSAFRQLNTLSP
jgi:hypothetical protein